MNDFKELLISTIKDSQNPIMFLKTIRMEIKNASFGTCSNFLKDYYKSQVEIIDLLLKEREKMEEEKMEEEKMEELLRISIIEEIKDSETQLESLKGMEARLENILRKIASCEDGIIDGKELLLYIKKQLMIVKRLILSRKKG